MLLVVYKEGLKVVVFLFTEYVKEKNPLKLEGDKIGLKLLTVILQLFCVRLVLKSSYFFKKIDINNFLALKT